MPPPFERSLNRLRACSLSRVFGIVLLGVTVFSPAVFGAGDHRSSRATGEAPETGSTVPEQAAAECCVGPGIINFGRFIDFNVLPDREEIQSEYRPSGVLFGRGASGEAPPTLVQIDWSRSTGCRKVLSGDPAFRGWEFFIFVDSLTNRWAAVQQVGASVGYCDQTRSCFIAAYDGEGNLLESKFNDQVGFQYLTIERGTADINIVMVGDCLSTGPICYPDPAGSALNCLSFSTPISSDVNLPASISMPQPPIPVGTPSTSPRGLAALVLALALAGIWGVRQRKFPPARS